VLQVLHVVHVLHVDWTQAEQPVVYVYVGTYS